MVSIPLPAEPRSRSRASLSDFVPRHIGPSDDEVCAMLAEIGYDSLDALTDAAIPDAIRLDGELSLEVGVGEGEAIDGLAAMAKKNVVRRSFIGAGYHGCVVPAVIRRNVLENPSWYTAYTPYQSEISQGRLEALVNYQTMVCDLVGLDIANASLLDEATAAAEAMSLSYQEARRRRDGERRVFAVSEECHPQTIDVVRTRADALDIEVALVERSAELPEGTFGLLLQYPSTDGSVSDPTVGIARAHDAGALVTVATDLLALTLLRPPGELGADIAVGSSQRFGVPMGFGGPHAAFFAVRESLRRRLPGRVVGVSRDAAGRTAYRLALQTREQHIRREKATSNICTAQVLPAVLAAMYAVYHGPCGLRGIAERVHDLAVRAGEGLREAGHRIGPDPFFDTLRVWPRGVGSDEIAGRADDEEFNFRAFPDSSFGISFDETMREEHLEALSRIFRVSGQSVSPSSSASRAGDRSVPVDSLPRSLRRESPYLEHPVFRSYHSETEMLRYLSRLAEKDLALDRSMIPLGSCTMKLNAASEMLPITWPAFAHLHPFAPKEQTKGYRALFWDLERMLRELTGFAAVSLQPNAGSQGELAGLLAIRGFHRQHGDGGRRVCLIPESAHGTNPASAVMAGMSVEVIKCSDDGDIVLDDLRAKSGRHKADLAALMVTYPSTHGVFEETIIEICDVVHDAGGLVYLDGANFNAMVGLCRPADFGVDVCHLNLHKTFCIPHGGGGPGVGPIAVSERLVPYLPGHGHSGSDLPGEAGAVSAAPWGSAGILPISWMYIRMMGARGLEEASRAAILNANYVAARLAPHYPVLYTGPHGLVAHECILDLRPLKASAGVEVEDVAKRLIDYGFHAPTVSWPVAGTLMIEPTESESQAEIDRFCDAMIQIREEVRAIEDDRVDLESSPVRLAPHCVETLLGEGWNRSYTREEAAFPAPWIRGRKYWPPVDRIDNVYGDRDLFCSCPPWQDDDSE